MSHDIKLKGITWDHPRGYDPLRATSRSFAAMHPNVSIDWDIRSLKEFGDLPIEDLVEIYDLITIDHPYMGQAHANKLILPLERYLTKGSLTSLAKQSVGASFKSYNFKEHIYALPIDAAALVAASRNDLLSGLALRVPKTRDELSRFYNGLPEDYKVAWPLCATDLWCSFLSLCAQNSGRDFIKDNSIEVKVGSTVLDELKFHLKYLHPDSINWNPIQILDHMGTYNEIIYVPYLFGYSNYSRLGYSKNLVHFSNSPTNPKNDVSTILGGVGLAVSTKSRHVRTAVDYVDYVANAKTQEGIYTQNNGQPGNLIAWESEENNVLCHNFFKDTITTMEKAYIRPQHEGWNAFQEQGAELLHHGLVSNAPSNTLIKDLNQLYQSIV